MENEKLPRTHSRIVQNARKLRLSLTPAKGKLWRQLSNRQLGGYKFRRQYPVGGFVLDFYCAASKLVIKLDGDSHERRLDYDEARTEWLRKKGIRVIRFSNEDININLEGVLEAILAQCK